MCRTGKALFCCLLLFCAFTGCRTAKDAAAADITDITATEEAVFASLTDNTLNYNTLTARLKIDYKQTSNSKDFATHATLKIKRNEYLLLSVRPLQVVELFRLEMNRDSLLFIDRLNKVYASASFDALALMTGVNLNLTAFQSLFTNKLFIDDNDSVGFNSFTASKKRRTVSFNALSPISQLRYAFTADATERLVASQITNPNGAALEWLYDSFDEQPFPQQMTVRFLADDLPKATAALDFTSIEKDVPVNTEFVRPPSGYVRITPEQLFKSYQKR